jgi:uncharacterized protein (DUF1697 family)
METYISILRGINVGGHRKIKMADLRKMYEKMGFADVKSYIQSGNVIFKTERKNIPSLEKELEEAIEEKFGFDVPVIIREKNEWKQVLDENPFLKTDASTEDLFVSFLSQTPNADLLKMLEKRETENDQIQLIGKNAFLKIQGSYHKTPLNNQWLEKTLQVKSTTRNWKGVLKIWELL